MLVSVPYGHDVIKCDIDSKYLVGTASKEPPVGIRDLHQAVLEAIENPIGTKKLSEIVQGQSTVSIVVNDITRPHLTGVLLSSILQELKESGVENRYIAIVIATGMHRPNTLEEQQMMFGQLPEDIRIINHFAKDDKSLTRVGITKRGLPVIINKHVAESDVKILTGIISPHQQAGFSGGRKSVLPGISSYQSIRVYHSPPYCTADVLLGNIEDNISHEESLEAARIAEIDFIVNLVHTRDHGVLKVVAGDLNEAWLEGVKYWKEEMQVKVDELADITIVTPGGFPRDINLWQSQKAVASAELITRKGGVIILVAQCKDGLGEDHLKWHRLLVEAKTPDEAIERFEREGYQDGTAKSYCFARASREYRLMIVSDFAAPKLFQEMFIEQHNNIQDALTIAIADTGKTPRIAVLPEGVECLPIMRNG